MARAPRDPDDTQIRTRDGRLNPARLDVTAKPTRKRKERDRPEPNAELKAAAPTLERRALARPHPPGVISEPAGFDEEHWTAPHSDRELWTLQLAEAFGTRSKAVIVTFMGQLEKLCGKDVWDEQAQQWRLDEHEFSAALALVNSVRPANEMQAALAAQMVAVHLLGMKCAARALKYDGDTQTAAVAGKLARTFAMQLDTLQSLQGKKGSAKQTIKVVKTLRQEVHYHDHRGEGETVGRPQEPRTKAIEGSAALQGPCEVHRLPVPSSRDARPHRLP